MLQSDVLNAVIHIIENPSNENLYESLKNPLLGEFQNSKQKHLQKSLENIQLGNKKTTAFLREVRQLSSEKVLDDLLKFLWLQRLPSAIKALLSASSGTLSLCFVLSSPKSLTCLHFPMELSLSPHTKSKQKPQVE